MGNSLTNSQYTFHFETDSRAKNICETYFETSPSSLITKALKYVSLMKPLWWGRFSRQGKFGLDSLTFTVKQRNLFRGFYLLLRNRQGDEKYVAIKKENKKKSCYNN